MTHELPEKLEQVLDRHGQRHLLRWWPDLTDEDRERLAKQIENVDFPLIDELVESHKQARSESDIADCSPAASLADRAEPPANLVGQTADNDEAARQCGDEALRAGKVGVILVAGGQGSRLGFEHAKGLFPIGPLTDRTLFQIFAEQLRACSRRYGVTIPYFIMTSDTTHDETVAFFQSRECFGLPDDSVFFFKQKMMPAVEAETGKPLLAEKASLALSPDGHGGMPDALQRNGLLKEMQNRGIELLYYHQVDNPAAAMCDPRFLGHHITTGSEFSTKVVDKVSAGERMGVLATVDGKTRIIEYIDFPPERAAEIDEAGKLKFRAGNTAIHVFNRDFLERLATEANLLPFHVSAKQVPYVDDSGESVKPAAPNAWKFERFIFDALPIAKHAMVLETDRASQFLPVKNSEGTDSPETCRAGLNRLYHTWLAEAGAKVSPDASLEISPLYADNAEALRERIEPGFVVDRPMLLSEEGPREVG